VIVVAAIEEKTLPALPEDWVPDDAVVSGFATHHADQGLWEVVFPRWAIVSRGASFDAAVHEASELLEDYFRICARDGVSYEKAARPIAASWLARLLVAAFASAVERRVRHRSAEMRMVRFPARHAFC
jgi:hypothetical protein